MKQVLFGEKIGMSRRQCEETNKIFPVTLLKPIEVFIDGKSFAYSFGKLKKPQEIDGKKRYGEGVRTNHIVHKPCSLIVSDGIVTARARSKGHGFSGTRKRYGFALQPKSHGGKARRRPGSIGVTGQAKVWKGKKMPGRHGGFLRSVRGYLKLEEGLYVFYGSLPGTKHSLVEFFN
jgi:ribosomal protein L3